MYHDGTFETEATHIAQWLTREYAQIHTGRAAPTLLDGVQVESYGSLQPLKNLASITIEDPKTLRVVLWDKGLIKEAERALYAANLSFSIVVDEGGIRVVIPALTAEMRVQLVKLAKDRLEDARIKLRKAREHALDALKRASLPEDALREAKDNLQELVDAHNTALEALYHRKEKEIQS
ncbi:MAG TPA: ribosome-recycling factor [Candidatus Paceibacterota bacterium]|nr:ribosome-recycling factor [Candidatus Paceibacterota bacterium]